MHRSTRFHLPLGSHETHKNHLQLLKRLSGSTHPAGSGLSISPTQPKQQSPTASSQDPAKVHIDMARPCPGSRQPTLSTCSCPDRLSLSMSIRPASLVSEMLV